MVAKKCDRCGSYYDTAFENPVEALARSLASVLYGNELLEKIESCVDLCPKCAEELVNWLNGGAFE